MNIPPAVLLQTLQIVGSIYAHCRCFKCDVLDRESIVIEEMSAAVVAGKRRKVAVAGTWEQNRWPKRAGIRCRDDFVISAGPGLDQRSHMLRGDQRLVGEHNDAGKGRILQRAHSPVD